MLYICCVDEEFICHMGTQHIESALQINKKTVEKFKIYFLKLLKKLRLWGCFNFVFSKKVNNVEVKIPILGDVGLTNMVLQKEWLRFAY